jgi:hypothetical protein
MLRWFGHVERVDERRLTKAIYKAYLGEHFLTKLGQF